jgi:hypothetical protein
MADLFREKIMCIFVQQIRSARKILRKKLKNTQELSNALALELPEPNSYCGRFAVPYRTAPNKYLTIQSTGFNKEEKN